MEIFHRYTPIRYKLLITYLVLTITAISFLGIIYYSIFSKSMENEAVNNALKTNKQMLNNLDYYINDLLKIGEAVQNNKQAAELLKNDNNYLSDAVRVRNEFTLYRSFKDFISFKSDLCGIMLITENNGVYKFSEEALDITKNAVNDDWYIDAVKSPESNLVQGPNYTSYYKDNKDKNVFSLVMKLEGPEGTTWEGEKLGVLRVDTDIRYFERLYSLEYYGYDYQHRTTILDDNLFIIYDTDTEKIGHRANINIEKALDTTSNGKFSGDFDGEKKLYVISTSKKTGCKVLQSIPYDDLLKDVKYIKLVSIFFGAVCIIFAVAVSVYLSYKITNPINQLMIRMSKVERGILESWDQIEAKDEIGDLTNSFSHMTRQLDDMIKNEYALKIKEKEAELSALQSQITPHFLYNTLETVRSIAVARNVKEIGVIAHSLAGMFRYSIKGERISTIDKEIEHVRMYLSIMKIRNPGKIDALIKVEDGLEDYRILKLILQPLVENACLHGLNSKEKDGLIAILIKKSKELIEIKVIDNGQGFDVKELEELNRLLSEEPKNYLEYNNKKFSIGILNVNSRIKLYYGNEYGLRYESKKGIGTTVYISIPAVVKGSDADEIENINSR